jgi:hypothetical protein
MADLSAQLVRGKQAAFEYKPITNENLSWLARTENQRNYLESQAKQKEQQALRDQLIKIQQLGLPKEMQGYLNSQVNDLIGKVRAGKIDPQSYDFQSAIAGIGGEANQLNTINGNLKTLAAEDKQVIDFDDLGAKDLAPELKNQYFGSYSTDYKPGTDVVGKYSDIQSKLNSGKEAIKFNDQVASTLTDAWVKRNAGKYADIDKLQKQGFSGYNLITELSKINPQAAEDYRLALESQAKVSLISEYAEAKRTSNAAGIPIEDQETYIQKRLSPYIPPQKQQTKQEIDADSFAAIGYREQVKGGNALGGIFSTPKEYNLNEYKDDKSLTETVATTLNLTKETTLDYNDPYSGELLKGQPTKINRLFYDPLTQEYILGFNRYITAKKEKLPAGVTLVDFGGAQGKFYLDKSEELYQRASEDDLNFDALVSTIMAESKSTRPEVIARLQAMKKAAATSAQPEIPKRMRSVDFEVDTSGTVLFNGKQITFKEVLVMSQNNKEVAVQFWSQRAPTDKVRKLRGTEVETPNINNYSKEVQPKIKQFAKVNGLSEEDAIKILIKKNII